MTGQQPSSLFQPAKVELAFFKAGVLGFMSGGKSFTSAYLAMGMYKFTEAKKPIFYFDTETGSDWFVEVFKKEGIPFHVAKTRAFKDLLDGVEVASRESSFLIIDSVTHFWREIVEAYREAKRSRLRLGKNDRVYLSMDDWQVLKPRWWEFTAALVNSGPHMIIAGRAGYEYQEEKEDNKTKLTKTDIKMVVEKETGYEPSIMLNMERHIDGKGRPYRRMQVIKDRNPTATSIDGKEFNFSPDDARTMAKDNKIFKAILPHVKMLNIGGDHRAVDTSRHSQGMFHGTDGASQANQARRKRETLLEEITAEMGKRLSSRKADDKKFSLWLLEAIFGTPSWAAIKGKSIAILEDGRDVIRELFSIYDGASDTEKLQVRLDTKPWVDAAKKAVADRRAAKEMGLNDPTTEPEPQVDGKENGAPDDTPW